MVAHASSRPPSPSKPKRSPLSPSDADNNGYSLPRGTKYGEVSSRYLSSTALTSSSSLSVSSTTTTSFSNSICTPMRRFPSPLVSATVNSKRAQSAERRRIVTPLVSSTNLMTSAVEMSSKRVQSAERRRIMTPLVSSTNLMTSASTENSKRAQTAERRRIVTPRIGEMTAGEEMLTKTPVRSLSILFKGNAVACLASKVLLKSYSGGFNNSNRLGTPERKAVTPVRKLGDSKLIDQQRWPGRLREGSLMTRSVDLTNEDATLKPNKPEINRSVDKLFSDSDSSDRAVSDVESVSSVSTLGRIHGAKPGALIVPARYRQDSVNCLRRVQSEPISPSLSQNDKLPSVNRCLKYGPVLSPRGLSPSPVRRGFRPASPRKSVPLSPMSAPSRGLSSPTRARSGMGSSSNVGNTPSVLSFAAETRRRKVGDNAIVDAHALRLLHNKYMQWRFANTRADAAMLVQRETARKSLYNSWVTTSKLRQSVICKQIEIQQLRQNLKLYAVLVNQMPFLNVWDEAERGHIVSLSETIASLTSSTLRLSLVDGAKVNIQSLKDAICLVADVMQAMTSLLHCLVTKAEHVNTLASELANTTRNERFMIDGCKDLLSILTHMEVQDCSMRTHILQLQRSQQP